MSSSSVFTDVPAGKIAAVVTYLEMSARPDIEAPAASPSGGVLRRVGKPQTDWYRKLYLRIGSDLLWFSALTKSGKELERKINRPGIEIFAYALDGNDEGLLELDFSQPDECELGFFGLTPKTVGTGAGRFMMSHAIEKAWSRDISRFWLHTCTLDHPNALPFYLRSGFTAYKRQVELADDPRLDGTLPGDAAPQVPVIAP